jgi:hypothetical protein
MVADVESRLKPFAREGFLTEVLVSTAQLARRD